MRKLKSIATAGAVCIAAMLGACASEPNPVDVMSRVKPGMTKDEVIDRLGPPDGSWGPWHSQCIEYGFQKYARDRYAIYINNRSRVVYIEHATCSVKRATEVGLR
jgi:outer membrane protein assembly factor BamE (lipoprotein component of BamABCDE complex)